MEPIEHSYGSCWNLMSACSASLSHFCEATDATPPDLLSFLSLEGEDHHT